MELPKFVLTILLMFFLTASTPMHGSSVAIEDKTIMYAMPYDFAEYSYWSADSYGTVQWTNPINAGLLKRSAEADRAYVVDLAESIPTANADGTVFTIKLKEDLKFNTGNPLTADDVVFSYHVLLTPAINLNSYGGPAEHFETNGSIVALDDYTVQFTLKDTYAFANGLFSYPIIDQDLFQNDYDACDGGDAEACNWNDLKYADGTAGPYKFESLDETNQVLTIAKNGNYMDAGNVWMDKITFKFILDKREVISELTAGNIDILDAQYKPLPDELSDIEGIIERYVPDLAHSEMSLNHLNPYYGTGEAVPDVESRIQNDAQQARLMRKAISHAIDREYIATEVMAGLAQPAASTMPPVSIGWREDIPVDEYSLSLARQIMESIGFDYSTLGAYNETGYEDSFFEVVVMTPNSCTPRNWWMKLIADTLPHIGIGVSDFRSVPWSEIIPRTFGYPNDTLVPGYAEGGFDMFFVSYGWDLDWDPRGLYDESGLNDRGNGDNFYNFINETVSAKVNEYISELDVDRRFELVGELQEMLHYNRPALPITNPVSHWAWSDDLAGIDEVLISISSLEWGNVRRVSHDTEEAFLQFSSSWIFSIFLVIPILGRKTKKRSISKV